MTTARRTATFIGAAVVAFLAFTGVAMAAGPDSWAGGYLQAISTACGQ